MYNSTHYSHGLCLYAVFIKTTSYKTNQTDSLQMETKVQSLLRSDLIHCLSSDSMWSHPEIPHTPHLFSIWPCSHAIQYCTAARPVLHRQQDSALKHFNEENKSGWRRKKKTWEIRLMQWCMKKGIGKWQHWRCYQLLICVGFVLHVHCLGMNMCIADLFQMIVYMMRSHCLPITWLTGCSVVFSPELNTHPAFPMSSFLCPGCGPPPPPPHIQGTGTYYFKSAEHMGLMLPESACK